MLPVHLSGWAPHHDLISSQPVLERSSTHMCVLAHMMCWGRARQQPTDRGGMVPPQARRVAMLGVALGSVLPRVLPYVLPRAVICAAACAAI